jgi:tetratricopeptide (TPR) repeat protein
MPSAEALKDEGNNFFKVGKYAEAVEKYLAATALDPNVPAYWYVVLIGALLEWSTDGSLVRMIHLTDI